MSRSFRSFEEAFTAAPSTPVAANDNKPRARRIRNNTTLPALRWLYDNHPELAGPVAEAIQSLAVSNWDSEASDEYLEIRPTVGELVRGASDGENEDSTPKWLLPTFDRDSDGNPFVQLGALKFVGGELVEYGKTKKGRRLQPRDMSRPRAEAPAESRNAQSYVTLRATTPSPLHAQPYQRAISDAPALPPMYDPQKGVEANRAALRTLGVDGSVAFADLPFPATMCKPAIAKGAEFLGGVIGPGGNTSSGAVNMGEVPDRPRGDVLRIIEEIASGATLKDIGERMGLDGVRVDRAAKDLLIDAAKVLQAANDNSRKKNAA